MTPILIPLLPTLAAAPASFSLSTLFHAFLKIGVILCGSGCVLVAFLCADFVERLGWLTEQQLIDAIAIGQETPQGYYNIERMLTSIVRNGEVAT